MIKPNENYDRENPNESIDYWEKMYREFIDFRCLHPTGMPPAAIKGVPNPLFDWVQEQHLFKHYLSPVQLAKLNAARFTWASNEIDPAWEQNYQAFLKFRQQNPDGMPPAQINKKYSSLYKWCFRQRKNKDMLNAYQLEKLKTAGFEWETPVKLYEEVWENNFRKFIEFISENPGSMPSVEKDGLLNPLYWWCNQQRLLKSRLGDAKRSRLRDAGFDWEKLEIFTPWHRRYLEFLAWRKLNPEGMPKRIIDGEPRTLQKWCYKQVNAKNQKKLQPGQIAKLNEAGFIWEIKDADAAWEKNYREFLEFRKIHPVGNPPTRLNGKANPLHSWYIVQRDLRDKLSPERLHKLNAAGFEWDIFKPDEAWEKHFNDFLEFKKENPGGMPVYVKKEKAKIILYNWCFKQRRLKDKMHANKKNRLDVAGFIWDVPDFGDIWEKHYGEYLEFVKNNPGKKPKPNGPSAERIISRWCYRQREGKTNLDADKIKKLDDIGFDWEIKSPAYELFWDRAYRRFLEFRAGSPEGMPPVEINSKKNSMYAWCVKQCRNKHLLTPQQIKKLDDAGFVWMITNKNEKWQEMFRKFIEFKANHPEGASISMERGKIDSLYEWSRTQQNKKSKLTPEQIKKLDDAGFIWNAKDLDETWEKHYMEFLAFRKENPKGMPVTFIHGKANPLHNWCRNQQNFRFKLPPERLKKLNDAGFDWYILHPGWMDHYTEFLEFRKKNKTGMPEENELHPNLSFFRWIQEQREHKEILPPDYIQKLDAAGFDW